MSITIRDNGTGGPYYREVARGYEADLKARQNDGKSTWRHYLLAAVFNALQETDTDKLEQNLLKAQEVIEDWRTQLLTEQ